MTLPGLSDATKKAQDPKDRDPLVAETEGKIEVNSFVPDAGIERKLERLLPKMRGVRSIGVEVENGVVTLTGHVEDNEVRDRVRDFALKVEGVNLVLNQTKTDAQVLTARELLEKRLGRFRLIISQTWLAAIAAIVVLVLSVLVARAFSYFSDRLLSPLFPSVLLRSVLSSVLSLAIVLVGLYAALQVVGVADTVLSIVGLAGVVALAVSFAFRDFAENFIASLLLGFRRPFRVGDYVEMAGYAGVVRALTTRATVLVTLEGHQVRIPNSAVFKNVIVNKTASDATRNSFDVVIPYDASTADAQEAITNALTHQDGVLAEPPPSTLVEGLEAGGVRLRAYFWLPNRGVDGLKVLSAARLKSKVALQRLDITPSANATRLVMPDSMAVEVRQNGHSREDEFDEAQTRQNLARDARASRAREQGGESRVDPIDQALQVARDVAGDEGENMLKNGDKTGG